MTVAVYDAPALQFRASDHTYWLDGKLVPNVTRVLSLVNDLSHIDPAVLENARQEGVDMHRMADLHWKGDLDEDTLPPWLRPRLEALKSFEAATGFQIIESEHQLYHPTYRYAGTLDLVGLMREPRGRQVAESVAIIDLKRSFAGRATIGLQVAAYAHAWNATRSVRIDRRFALQLRADGTYRLEPFNDGGDFSNFLACLSVWRLKERIHE